MTGISELDRVLGGGIVIGSVTLIGGEPGIGKSTILLQLCGEVSKTKNVLYVTGEESVRQIKLRAVRLNVPEDNISLVAESDVDEICGLIESMKPDLVVIDSIQTMRCTDISSSSGTVSQVKESSARFLNVAKTLEIPTFIVGHVNKDGAIAGPKVMEHIVDTVLYFEGDKTLPYRVLRAVKNRYGSTNEIGMFDMTGRGLAQIENPSQVMLEGRPIGISGTCVACVMEGTRPVLSEIQALATKTSFPSPRRTASGFDYNRMYLLLAVLEKRAGYAFYNQDVYINIIGGLKLDETACDLPVCIALASSLLDLPVDEKTIAIGEVGLGGEVRSVTHLETRLREAQRVGFDTAIVPKHNLKMIDPFAISRLEARGRVLPAGSHQRNKIKVRNGPMPEQNEKNLPKAPAFNPKVKETIAAFKENNNPKNLNDILNELVRSPLLAPAVFDLQGQPAPKPEADGRVQLPKETKISLVMVTSPEGKRYYLGFSDWDAVHEWQKAQPKAAQQIILLRFDDYANMIAKNAEASGLVINPGDNSLRLERR